MGTQGRISFVLGRRATVVARIILLGVVCTANAFAAGGRTDYDLDNDGLIEIDDLDDLDAMREFPFGNRLYDSEAGCPAGGCHGFELTTDLDFDTNQDGAVNLDDDHYSGDGVFSGGWLPIPTLAAIFEGNNHTLRNFTEFGGFQAPDGSPFLDWPAGLFSDLVAAQVRNLRFEDVNFVDIPDSTGVLAGRSRISSSVRNVSVVGGSIYVNNLSFVGGLIGDCEVSSVEESFTSLDVKASGRVGGLIGRASDCSIKRSFVLGRTASARYDSEIGGLVGLMDLGSIEDSFVSGSAGEGPYFGGLIGRVVGGTTIKNTFVSGAVIGNSFAGGALLGFGDATFTSSFFATDTSGFSKTRTDGGGATGVTLAQLKCSDAPSDPDCLAGLFAGWQTTTNSSGQPAWDFGTNQQVPALRIQGIVYRDSDGDGLLDADDEFPFAWEASLDTDNDGAIDFWREGCNDACRAASSLVLDQFPLNAAARSDLDLDGRPDAWNASCNAACQAASGLTLDTRPGDFDNDGLADLADLDDNADGVPDVDADSDNLIDISTLARLAQVNLDPTGASLRTDLIPEIGAVMDTSGCRPRVVRSVLRRECDGYELLSDLDFDTNGNGAIDENDAYWNEGVGWLSLGHHGDVPVLAFQTNFEGNGHSIANLYEDYTIGGGNETGFFGGVRGANIRNLALVGGLTSLTGVSRSGAFIADLITSTVTNCYSTGPVTSTGGNFTGGFIGEAKGAVIRGCFATGDVEASGTICNEFGCSGTGGLVGSLSFDATLSASFASGAVVTNAGTAGGLVGTAETGAAISGSFATGFVGGEADEPGGLVGRAQHSVIASYWATDSSMQTVGAGNAQGATNAQLQCPIAAENTTCLPGVTLFDDWGQYRDQDNLPYWDFGSASELPGLCLDGTLHRVNAAGVLEPPADCFCTDVVNQLVTNQGFESNTAGWVGSPGTTLSSSTALAHSGARSLRIANRNVGSWQGAEYNLLGVAVPGETLAASLWARIVGDPTEPVLFTLRSICQGGPTVFTTVASGTATSTGWVQISGNVTIPSCNLTQLVIYAEGPRTTVVLHIDDVSITRTTELCEGSEAPLNGSFIVTNSWNTGYCVELRVTNPMPVATTDWSATFNLNGTTIYDIWNLDRTSLTGSPTVSPNQAWGQVIAPGGSSHSLGFCANRPQGSTALPSGLVVTGVF